MSNDEIINKIISESFSEQKKQRNWGIFFKILTFTYLFLVSILFYINFNASNHSIGNITNSNHVAVININGQIKYGGDWSSENIIKGLEKAFLNDSVKFVVLNINSPGGSPVQSDEVFQYIMEMKKKTSKPVISIVNDLAASGAYYIASASDHIYANKVSLVGSIGVISGGFGFSGLMDKIGVERRVYTSGENKAMLDPFSPEKEEQILKWKEVLSSTHEVFINSVKTGRGEKLKDDPEIFSGRIWSGIQALDLGLIDGFESIQTLKNNKFKDLEIIDYTNKNKVNIYKILESSGKNFSDGVLSSFKTNEIY